MSLIPEGPRLTPPDSGVPDDLDLLAAEYVLGSLSDNERAALLARAPRAELRSRIVVWEERLAPLAECVPAASPPPELWQRLLLATSAAKDTMAKPVKKPTRSQSKPANPAPFWRFMTAAMTIVAAGLAAYIIVPPPQVSDPLLAALSPAGLQPAAFIVRVDSLGIGTVYALPQAAAPSGRSLQLWALSPAPAPPVSLGLLDPTSTVRLRVRSSAGTILAVSLEPQGGSPTGKPTGPVIFTGTLTNGI